MKVAIGISLFVGAIASQASWRSDISVAQIPANPATGKVHNKAFKPMLAKINTLGQNSVSTGGNLVDRSQIYLTLPDKTKSFLAGSFTGEIES